MSSSIETLVNREYKYGFVTDIESDTIPPGLSEDIVRADLGQEGRAGVDARVAAQGVPPLADDEGAALAERHVQPDRLPGHQLLLGAEDRRSRSAASTKSIPSCSKTYEKLGIPLTEQKMLAGVAVDAIFDSRVGRHDDARTSSAKHGIIFCSFGEARARASRAGARSISARSCRTATTSSPR